MRLCKRSGSPEPCGTLKKNAVLDILFLRISLRRREKKFRKRTNFLMTFRPNYLIYSQVFSKQLMLVVVAGYRSL